MNLTKTVALHRVELASRSLPWALPGVLISLALLWAALGSGNIVKLIYGTVFLLILAIIIKEMPLGSQIIKAGVMHLEWPVIPDVEQIVDTVMRLAEGEKIA
jgi:ABC-type Fe3+ transport system permease subunit